jgi:hypothetical protein
MANKTMTLTRAWLWPNVATRRLALEAINEAFWVTLFISGLTLLFALIEITRSSDEPFDLSAFVSPVFFALAAFGIRAKSRYAALFAFALFVVSRLYVFVAVRPFNPIVPGLIAIALLHGVRGTFACHKLPPVPAGTPSIEESFQAMRRDPQPSESDPAPR